MSGYELSRVFWDYCFENPHKVKPHHVAIYFFAIEHCNRLGWKEKFGFPTGMVMEAVGIRSYSAYKNYFDELVEFGFFKIYELSKNQYSSNIIGLAFNAKATTKALDKATLKHTSKQSESTRQSIDSIDKHITYNNEPTTTTPPATAKIDHETFFRNILSSDEKREAIEVSAHLNFGELTPEIIRQFMALLITESKHHTTEKEFTKHLRNWLTKGAHKKQSNGTHQQPTRKFGRTDLDYAAKVIEQARAFDASRASVESEN